MLAGIAMGVFKSPEDAVEKCVKEFLKRETQETSPIILFNPSHNNFKDYIVDDFQLINYNPQPNIKMEIAL